MKGPHPSCQSSSHWTIALLEGWLHGDKQDSNPAPLSPPCYSALGSISCTRANPYFTNMIKQQWVEATYVWWQTEDAPLQNDFWHKRFSNCCQRITVVSELFEKRPESPAWFKNREKTGHLPLSIVKQEGLNPDYGRGKTCVRLSSCMSVCVCGVCFCCLLPVCPWLHRQAAG